MKGMTLIKNRSELLGNSSSTLNREARELALKAIESAIEAVNPKRVIESRVSLSGDILRVDGRSFNLSRFRRVMVIGGGKASGSMAEAIEGILGDRIETGIVVIPHGTRDQYRMERIELHEAGHPIPDEDSVEGARKIIDLVSQTGEDDLVICLISGGGSSLMCLPRDGIPLQDKRRMTDLLLRCGANINEFNTVRKHISRFKGGSLAREVYPSTLISLILSDVVGDPLEVIASGPTVADPTTFKDATYVLKKYDIWDETPESIKRILQDGLRGSIEETPKPGDPIFERVHNIVVGNNRMASWAALKELKRAGLNTVFLTSFMEGEARDVGIMLAALAREVRASGSPVQKPAGLVVGGETTVTVTGTGKGGRNQEVALGAALKIDGLGDVLIASVSTDGVDGPTDAAGALADGYTIARSRRLNLNAEEYLRNNDSYNFFSKLGDLVITGPTGTNVNDISIVIVL